MRKRTFDDAYDEYETGRKKSSVKCPECGKICDADEEECPECGYPLWDEIDDNEIDYTESDSDSPHGNLEDDDFYDDLEEMEYEDKRKRHRRDEDDFYSDEAEDYDEYGNEEEDDEEDEEY